MGQIAPTSQLPPPGPASGGSTNALPIVLAIGGAGLAAAIPAAIYFGTKSPDRIRSTQNAQERSRTIQEEVQEASASALSSPGVQDGKPEQVSRPVLKPSPKQIPSPSLSHEKLSDEELNDLQFGDGNRQRLLGLAEDPQTHSINLMNIAAAATRNAEYHKKRREDPEKQPYPIEGDYDEELMLALLRNPNLPEDACLQWLANSERYVSCAKGGEILRALANHPAALPVLSYEYASGPITRALRKVGDGETVIRAPSLH